MSDDAINGVPGEKVKRYAYRLSRLSEVMGGQLEVIEYSGDGLPYVLSSDYDALEAECERLRKEKSARQALSIQLIDEARALRAELAAIKRQQPVAWRMWNGKTWRFCYSYNHAKNGWEPLYLSPPPGSAARKEGGKV